MRTRASNTTVWVAVALAIGLSVTAAATWRQIAENRKAADAAVHAAAEGVAANVTERLFLYQYGMRGLRGAILTAGEMGVTNALFNRYAASRDIDMEFPGARGFGFVRRVPVAEEAAYVERIRADGRPDFHITRLMPSTRERLIIENIAPFGRNAAAIGLDISSDPNRREAAEVSMRTGQTAISAPITLLQNPDKTQKSFLLMIPIYRPVHPRARRRNATPTPLAGPTPRCR